MTPEQFEEFTTGMTDDQFDCLAELIQDALDLQVQNHHRARQKGRADRQSAFNSLYGDLQAMKATLEKERASHAELQKFIAIMNLNGYRVSGLVWEDIVAGEARVIQDYTSMDKRLVSQVWLRDCARLRSKPTSAAAWNPEQKLEAQEIEYE